MDRSEVLPVKWELTAYSTHCEGKRKGTGVAEHVFPVLLLHYNINPLCINNSASILSFLIKTCAKQFHTHTILGPLSVVRNFGPRLWLAVGIWQHTAAWEPGGEKQPQMAHTYSESTETIPTLTTERRARRRHRFRWMGWGWADEDERGKNEDLSEKGEGSCSLEFFSSSCFPQTEGATLQPADVGHVQNLNNAVLLVQSAVALYKPRK